MGMTLESQIPQNLTLSSNPTLLDTPHSQNLEVLVYPGLPSCLPISPSPPRLKGKGLTNSSLIDPGLGLRIE